MASVSTLIMMKAGDIVSWNSPLHIFDQQVKISLNLPAPGACDDADFKRRKEKYLLSAKLYMAILRTGQTFYHLGIAQQQFYRAAQKFLTNCHAGPNGSEMGRVLQMRGMVVGWLVDGATGEV